MSTRSQDAVDFGAVRQKLVQAEDVLAGHDPGEDRVRILEERAAAVARTREEAQAGGMPVLAFKVGGERYAVEVGAVFQVVDATGLTPLPATPPWVLGAILARTRVVPVLDLRALLGLEGGGMSDLSKVVVLEDGGELFGVAVEDAGGAHRSRAREAGLVERRTLRLDRARPAGGPGPAAPGRAHGTRQLTMERELLNQIWPIFSAEAREHLSSISSGVMELEDDPSRLQVLDGIRRTAHSLKGSAGSLGLGELERLAHAIEGSLAEYDPAEGLSRATVMAALDAVQAIEQALEAGDSGADPGVPRLAEILECLGAPASPGVLRAEEPAPATAEAGLSAGPAGPMALLEHLELSCSALVQPLEAADRIARAGAATAVARQLAALVAASPLPGRIAENFVRLGEGEARAAAAIAGDLVDLRTFLETPVETGGPAPAPAAAPAAQPQPQVQPQGAAAAAAGPTDKSIRVLASTMDSLSRQLEILSLGESRHRRRAGLVREVEQSLRDGVRGLERVGHALRTEQPEEAKQELPGVMERLRTLAVRLARLARETVRETDNQRLTSTLLREDLRALRMVPASMALEPLRRAVREVAGRTGKEVDLHLSGSEVRLDRRVVDELRDPLLHLVRNAVYHGIETPEARRKAGKLPRGQLRVTVELRGTRAGVVVEDDGGGVDVPAVRARASRTDAGPRRVVESARIAPPVAR